MKKFFCAAFFLIFLIFFAAPAAIAQDAQVPRRAGSPGAAAEPAQPSGLVGTWYNYSGIGTHTVYYKYVFRADGTYEYRTIVSDSSKGLLFKVKGTWRASGDTIYFSNNVFAETADDDYSALDGVNDDAADTLLDSLSYTALYDWNVQFEAVDSDCIFAAALNRTTKSGAAFEKRKVNYWTHNFDNPHYFDIDKFDQYPW